MENLVLIIHFGVCAFLIVVILLQAGKGADMGAAFGGSSQTVFGSRGAATFLSKLTTTLAVVFLATSIILASFSRIKGKSSILKTVIEESSVPLMAPGLELEGAAKSETKPAQEGVTQDPLGAAPAEKGPEETK